MSVSFPFQQLKDVLVLLFFTKEIFMLRKITAIIICAASIFTTSAYSTTQHVFTQGLAVEYEFPVNDPQVFSNIFFWTIKATCTIVSGAPESLISAKMLKKTGIVNGTTLATNETFTTTLRVGDKLNIVAIAGSQVELINLGTETIKASCTTD